MNNSAFEDWKTLLAGFAYQNGNLSLENNNVLSEEHLATKLYDRYKNKASRKTDTFQLNDFANKIVSKIYPESINEQWQLKKIHTDDQSFIIRKAYTERSVTKENCILSNQADGLSLGSEIDILLLKASYEQQEEQIVLYGKFYPTDNNDDLIRYYFNFTLELDNLFAFERFLLLVMNGLNERGISFKLKFLDNVSKFKRADSLVIYIEKFHYLASFECIKQSYLEVKSYLIVESNTPLFTHKIADGWGFAEEPKDDKTNLSFGQQRTTIIAKFIWKFPKTNPFDAEAIYKAFEKKQKENYDFDNFHLNKKSILQIKKPTLSATAQPKLPIETNSWAINATNMIGFHLCRQAIWGTKQIEGYKEEALEARKCTWLNAEISNEEEMAAALNNSTKDFYLVKSVNAGLGDGLAGILYFLVKLYQIQKSKTLLNTIHGAANNLFDKYEKLATNGLFNGKIGVILVLNELSEAKDYKNLVKANIERINKIEIDFNDNLDFYEGLSGQIWALVVLYLNTSNTDIKDVVKNILLKAKKEIIKKAENYNEQSPVGLNGLSGVVLMLAAFTYFLGEIKDTDAEDTDLGAKKLLSTISSATLKLETNNTESGWSGILIALVGAKAVLADAPNYRNLLNAALLKVIASFLTFEKQEKTNYSVNSGFFSTVMALNFYENFSTKIPNLVAIQTPYLEDFMQKVYSEILEKQNLPSLGLGKNINSNTNTEYYNPGVLNGISGIGLMFLKMRNNNPGPVCFLDQIVKKPT